MAAFQTGTLDMRKMLGKRSIPDRDSRTRKILEAIFENSTQHTCKRLKNSSIPVMDTRYEEDAWGGKYSKQ